MKVIELFSGNGDITQAFIKEGIECLSVDYDEKKKPMLVSNVYELSDDFLKQFSFIWLSPDCTTYSFASHGLHRIKGGVPVSEYAKQCDDNNIKLFAQLKRLNIPFICENPRCHFRNMSFVKGLKRITVYYSTYGCNYTKPTDLFSNCEKLLTHFDSRKSRGTIHLDYVKSYGDFLGRCKMPEGLINDIINAVRTEL